MARPRTQAAPATKPAEPEPEPEPDPAQPTGVSADALIEGLGYPQPDAVAAVTAPLTDAYLDEARAVAYQDGWNAGYEAGARAAAPPVPLFEQAKRLVARLEHQSEAQVVAALADLQADAAETIAAADIDLLLIQHRKAIALRRARADERARPRERARELAPSTQGQTSETTYEHVS